ncbi:MAG: DNA repair exonuclease [Candidatus Cloacimonetes bacterium]|jgi:DNA repair protein SbcD/Mre11|nr:DNA repair exonuclease [Candidatus Cloacimonadota bacterium]MBT4332542.1 DNA repair exonuclease [Candidatus Cloacimonadota bacterium]MBT4576296.1 DNA repair exonuclease [Candidatus Cloacimonadota bacterium]
MLKIVFFADTHLGVDYPIRPKIEQRRRGDDFFDNFKRVLDYAVEAEADLVLHGGDFFFRSKVPAPIVDKAYDVLYDFAKNGIPFIIVPGNHERSVLPTSILMNHKNIHIFDEPSTFFFEKKNAIIGITGFPNIRNGIKLQFEHIFAEATDGNPEVDIKLLLMHQAIQESQIEGFTFRYGIDVLPLEMLPADYHAILSGHIHRAQIFHYEKEEKQIPVIYPGSTERTSIVEMTEEKGFYELIFDELENNWELVETKFHILPTRPMVRIDITKLTEDEKVLRNLLEAELSKLDQNSVVRLRCEIPEARKLLRAELLRELTPKTMTLTLAPVYRKRK